MRQYENRNKLFRCFPSPSTSHVKEKQKKKGPRANALELLCSVYRITPVYECQYDFAGFSIFPMIFPRNALIRLQTQTAFSAGTLTESRRTSGADRPAIRRPEPCVLRLYELRALLIRTRIPLRICITRRLASDSPHTVISCMTSSVCTLNSP